MKKKLSEGRPQVKVPKEMMSPMQMKMGNQREEELVNLAPALGWPRPWGQNLHPMGMGSSESAAAVKMGPRSTMQSFGDTVWLVNLETIS